MRGGRRLFPLLLLALLPGLCHGRESAPGAVTCGSVLKLLNTRHSVRLHSHEVKYGSGSGQQSVTGVEASDDANSYWRIRGKSDSSCQRGTPVKCGQAIRLTHVNTGKNLHTHHFPSPLSNNQEVSAFGDDGEGDDLDFWIVQCSGSYWEREDAVRFKHVGTEVFLSITGEQYGHPIRGQREVHGMPAANHHNYWKAMEGVFIKPSLDPGSPRLLLDRFPWSRSCAIRRGFPFGMRMKAELPSLTGTVSLCEPLRGFFQPSCGDAAPAGFVGHPTSRPQWGQPAEGPAPLPTSAVIAEGFVHVPKERVFGVFFLHVCLAVQFGFLGIRRLPIFFHV